MFLFKEYTIVHISGEDNSWDYLLSSRVCLKAINDAQSRERHFRLSSLLKSPLAPTIYPDFQWPTVDEIKLLQSIDHKDVH